MRRLLTAAAALVALAVLAPAAHAEPDPLTCAGYSEPRVFLEAQIWWGFERGMFARLDQLPDLGDEFGHGHLGACVPLDSPADPITGDLRVDYVVKLHGNPGYVKRLEEEISDVDGDVGLRTVYTGGTAVRCPLEAPEDCTFILETHFDTSVARYDGRVQLQPRVIIPEPDGNFMRPSLRFPFYVENGNPPGNNVRSTNVPLGYGWYGPDNANAGYAWGRLDSGVPAGPVSGLWSFRASFLSDGGGHNTTYYRIAVDPDIHHGRLGTILAEGVTDCVPGGHGCSGPRKRTFTLDTTELADGRHKLMLLTDAQDPLRLNTNSGIFVAPFTVSNP